MQFNSFEFILVFLPITVIGYFLLNRWNYLAGKIGLIFAGMVFYAFAGRNAAIALGISIVLNYVFALLIAQKEKYSNTVFIFAIVINIATLLFFKYHDFYIEEFGWFIGRSEVAEKMILPLGISFFTFQQIAYLAYVKNNREPDIDVIDYLLYILFFPKLIMGPITEPDDIMPQFNDSSRKKADENNIASGSRIFSFGLFKKALLADTFAAAVSWGFGNIPQLSSMDTFVVMLSYTFEIYFDFSGYSDMAMGVAMMLNVDLPINFDSPYKATSIRDFWKRWHISLTRFLTKYVFIPLGGSRRGTVRTCLNILIVFLISGMWHGANWTFMLWGLIYGLLNVTERIFEKWFYKLSEVVRWIYTFLTVNVLWLLFTSESVQQWRALLQKIFCFRNTQLSEDLIKVFEVPETSYIIGKLHLAAMNDNVRGLWAFVFIVASFLICLIPENNYRTRKEISVIGSVFAAIAFIWGFICLGSESVFVYFGF